MVHDAQLHPSQHAHARGPQDTSRSSGSCRCGERRDHSFGCKVVAQYAVLGPYDFVTLIDAPDNETVAHLSVDLGSRGTVNILTLPAIEIGDFRRQLERREQLGHD